MNTWFSVDETNNQFYLVEWTYGLDGGNTFNTFRPQIITMPVAPYDINSFLTQLPGQVAQGDLQHLPDVDRPQHRSHQRSAGSELHDHT